jgi:hypothetical protein
VWFLGDPKVTTTGGNVPNKFQIGVGGFVKLSRKGPFPRLMRGSFQKVVGIRAGRHGVELRIERIHHSRKVRCWIGIEFVERLAQATEFSPQDSCLIFASRTAGSAKTQWERQWCRVCRLKESCESYKIRAANEREDKGSVHEREQVEGPGQDTLQGERLHGQRK